MDTPRFEPMTVELSFTRDLPWRVYDNKLGHALKTNSGRTIRLETEDRALALATLMNEKVGWKF